MATIILISILLISFFTDIKDRRILNIVTLPAIAFALIYHSVTGGFSGFQFSFFGFLVGLGLLFIPFAMGGMGAGDVKLLAAVGALQGPAFVFSAFLYTAMIGGLIAVLILLKQGQLMDSIKRILFASRLRTLDIVDKKELHHAFPYGVAIVLGTFIVQFGGWIQ
ncbi:A24 family peptidase [Pseudalkalibacillus caeni]|uniref:Prepilin peptidase n=1 Tax=Exobacillus caeni TaxID=2574798 RepID=A0A5R9F3Y6_9BACL|nr:prepilin peptidase [Pseudalkalibacillus caeni]TLS35573.1 prepilin peptidase [Pseudalkalibacillus caeni]